MNTISEQVQALRDVSQAYKQNGLSLILAEAADTIESISAKLQAANEKQIPREPIDDAAFGTCPNCHSEFNSELLNEYDMKYCLHCGQALDTKVKNVSKTADWKEHFAMRFDRFE